MSVNIKNILFTVAIIVSVASANAQTADSTQNAATVPADTTEKSLVETTPAPASKQQTAVTYWKPSPNRSMWLSVLCPGLGQIYNRSYWKVPVIYGGGALFAYLISWQGRMYNDYSNAYYDFMDNDPNTRSYERIFRNLDGTDTWKEKTLKNKRDTYRRNRDLCIFGVALLYVLNIVDAYVDGHLYDFSVTDDLSFHAEPFVRLPYEGLAATEADGGMVGLKCNINF